MKKIYLIFVGIFIMAFLTPVSAQSRLGVFSGLNFGKLTGDAPQDAYYYSLPGFNGGVNLDISINKILDLSLQPSFSQAGVAIFYKVPLEPELVDSIAIRLNYFSLPVLLKVESTNKHFYALGGFEFAYLASQSVHSGGNKLDDELDINAFDVTAQFGAGYRIFLGLPRLYLELRYSQGLFNLTDHANDEGFIPRVRTSGFKFLFGIEFPLSKPSKQ